MIKLLSIVTLLTCFSAQASTVARVLEVKGNAFAFTGGKNPRVLKYGDQVEDLSDVMVEDSSQLSLVNTEGDVMHITGGTLLKVYKKYRIKSRTNLDGGKVSWKYYDDKCCGRVS